MASEYNLTLKASLDTTDVQQQLDRLNQAANAGVNPSQDIPDNTKNINSFAQSMKNLKQAMGGMVVARSVGNLLKATQAFGDGTDKIVNQITSSANHMMMAMATGNPAIVAFTAAIEALSFTAGKAQEELRQAQEALGKTEKMYKEHNEFRAKMSTYREGQTVDQIADSGNASKISQALSEYVEKRNAAYQRANDASQLKNLNVIDKTGLFEELQRLDGVVKQLRGALERVTDAETKRVKDLEQAKSDFSFDQQVQQAKQSKNSAFFYGVMEQAKEAMRKSTTADDFKKASRNYSLARDQIDSLAKEEKSKINAGSYASILKMLGGETSGFSSLGFGMGEKSMTTTISNQIDEIIRLLQDQLRKDMEVVNEPEQSLTI